MKFWILVALSLISMQAKAHLDEREINIFTDPELGYFMNEVVQDYSRNKSIAISVYYEYNLENLMDPDQKSWILITSDKNLVKSLENNDKFQNENLILQNSLALYTKENNELLDNLDDETDFSKILEHIKTGSKLIVGDKSTKLGEITENYLQLDKLDLNIERSISPALLLSKKVIEEDVCGINFLSAVNNNKHSEILATIESTNIDDLNYQVVISTDKGVDEAKFLLTYLISEKAKLLFDKHGLRTKLL